jgi:site-specific DNA recombinase
MTVKTQPRTWVYARYSTDKQTQKSLDDQIAECRRLCAKQGWPIANVLSDAEVTGFTSNRSGYQALIRGIENGEVDLIVAENIDRVVRDAEHSAQLDKLLTYYEVEFWTIQEGKISAIQLMFKTFMSAEMRRAVALQAHRGLGGNVDKGKSAGGLSYGYELGRDERGDRIAGELCIVDNRAEVVRRIMTEYADGRTPRQIASDLNAEGIPSPSGGAWRQNTINGNNQRHTGILNNELYIGIRVWNRLQYRLHPTTQKRVSRLRPAEEWVFADVPHLRIVDDELWDRVKRRQLSLRGSAPVAGEDEKPKRPHTRRPKYLLSGLLLCKSCGGKLTIAGPEHRKYYYCQRAKEEGPSSCTGMTGLRREDAEAAVLAGLKRDLMRPAAVATFRDDYAAALREASKGSGAEKEMLERRLKKLEKQIGNATAAVMGGLNSPALLAELGKAEEQKAEVTERLARMDLPSLELPDNLDRLYADLVRDLEATLANPDLILRAIDVMKDLVDEVVVEERPEGGHTLDVKGNLARMLRASAPSHDWQGFDLSRSSLGMVAGVGFEPTTFRL